MPLRVLLLGDRPDAAELIVHELRRAGFEPDWQRVEGEAEYLARLDTAPDLILADYSLSEVSAPRALALLQARGVDVPFIVVSGTVSEQDAVECLKQGAADYLFKERLERLGPAVTRALNERRAREERRQVEAALRERTRQLEAIRAVTEEITGELDLTMLLGVIVRRAVELVGAVAGEIWLWDEAAQVLAPAAWHGVGEWLRELRLRLDEGVSGTVARRRAGLIVNDYPTSPYVSPIFPDRMDFTAIVSEPLLYRDRLVGTISILNKEIGRPFTERDRSLLALFANQAAIAIENARLFTETERRRREAEVVADLGQAISASLDLGTVLQRVAEGARELCRSDVATVDLRIPGTDAMVFRYRTGTRVQAPTPLRVEAGKGVGGQVLLTGRPFRTTHYAEDPRISRDYIEVARAEGTVAAMVVPIRGQDRVEGALYVNNRSARPFTDRDEAILLRLADHAAIAIGNSQLFERERAARAQAEAAEARQAAVLETALDCIITIDHRGKIVEFNPAAEATFGFRRDDVLGRQMADLIIPPALRERHRQGFAHYLATGEGPVIGKRLELTGMRADGTEFPVELAVTRIPSDGPPLFTGHLRDISTRRRAEEALRESEERFRRVFEDTAVGMALQTPEGRYLRVNRALCEMLGYSEGELRALTYQEIEHPDDRGRDVGQDREMLAGARGWYQREKRYLHKRGHVVWVLVTVSLVRAVDGRPLHFLVHAQDITGRKRTEEALRQSEKLATMGELLAGVAHELNNPLAVVIGHAHLLQREAGAGQLGMRAAKIAQAADRCGRIVRNFLAIARQHPTERTEVALNEVVREAVELLAYPFRVDDIEVRLDLPGDLPALRADPHQLHQVVVNLLSNAHHALREAPPPRRLTLTTRFDPGSSRVTLEVADTGRGIPPEIQARLFEPFFTTKPLGQGTGLGLSLCQGIVEAHGGRIRVESAPGHGAVFLIELPVAAQAVAEADAHAPDALGPIRGKAILVVDDEPGVAGVLAELLAADGHHVKTAENGAVALEMLQREAYDLILTDVRMPELDGPGLYREVEQRDPDLTRRFIFLTGDGLSAGTDEFVGRTSRPWLSKPFNMGEVRRVVQETLVLLSRA